jgi:UDP-N-acetyl-D-galactosamine dehydrogenase
MGLKPLTKDTRISILGLGYVGLPLAFAFARQYPTVGYDINKNRIAEISQRIDVNN